MLKEKGKANFFFFFALSLPLRTSIVFKKPGDMKIIRCHIKLDYLVSDTGFVKFISIYVLRDGKKLKKKLINFVSNYCGFKILFYASFYRESVGKLF